MPFSNTHKRTDKTLYEQMQLSEIEIERRKEFLNISDTDLRQLSQCKEHIEQEVDGIVNEFYELQTAIDEIQLLIGDSDTLKRLRMAQRKYVLDLFSGKYDSDYVNNRLRIGLVHKRIGVEPKLYLSAVRTLKGILHKHFDKLFSDANLRSQVYQALDKLMYFDITLVFDTYIRSLIAEIETAKSRTENYAKSLEDKVAERTQQLEDLSRRDPLTNLYNHRALKETLYRDLIQAKRRERHLSLIYFDIDDFKQVNDNQGHHKGDEMLVNVSHILGKICREADVPCRYGGDEFCVILPECDSDNARKVAERLISLFTKRYPKNSLSIGIATTGPLQFVESDPLIREADKKMYLAKKIPGSNIVC